ncbi:hypothetical protein seszw180S_21 [Salmonella phage seszw]|nr:hypothetical protein seszw180S_21 [Salmonella phage seszw]
MGSTNGPSRSRATGNTKTGGKTGAVKPNVGTGIGLKVAEQTPVTQSYFEAMIPHSLTEWAAVASILGALSLVIKNLFEMWWKVRESKRNGSTNT